MIAYHGKPELKAKVLDQLAEHRRKDQITQQTYWDEGSDDDGVGTGIFYGCAVGCLTHDGDGGHAKFPRRWGIPMQVAYIVDGIFESHPAKCAPEWPLRIMEAIPVGADLRAVSREFRSWILAVPSSSPSWNRSIELTTQYRDNWERLAGEANPRSWQQMADKLVELVSSAPLNIPVLEAREQPALIT